MPDPQDFMERLRQRIADSQNPVVLPPDPEDVVGPTLDPFMERLKRRIATPPEPVMEDAVMPEPEEEGRLGIFLNKLRELFNPEIDRAAIMEQTRLEPRVTDAGLGGGTVLDEGLLNPVAPPVGELPVADFNFLPERTPVPPDMLPPEPVVQDGPTPEGARIEQAKVEQAREIAMQDERVTAAIEESLREAGVTSEDGRVRALNSAASAFAEGAAGTAILAVYEKIPGTEAREKIETIRELQEEGVVDPNWAGEMVGLVAGIGLDIAITRRATGLGRAADVLKGAAKTKAGVRGIGALEGALEGVAADAWRAATLEEEGIEHVGAGTAIGAAAGAVIPGSRGVTEAVGRVQDRAYQEAVAEAAGRRVAQDAASRAPDASRALPGPSFIPAPSPEARIQEGVDRARQAADDIRAERQRDIDSGDFLPEVDEQRLLTEGEPVVREAGPIPEVGGPRPTPERTPASPARQLPGPDQAGGPVVRGPVPDEPGRRVLQDRRVEDVGPPDVSERRRFNRRQVVRRELQQAKVDDLTGLRTQSNMRRWLDRVESDPNTSIVEFDATNFKALNDIVSPAEGDRFLAELGEVVRQAADEFGVGTRRLARSGGDEVMAAVPSDQAEAFASRVKELVAERGFKVPDELGPQPVGVRAGIGDTRAAAAEAAQAAKKTETGPVYDRASKKFVRQDGSEVKSGTLADEPDINMRKVADDPQLDMFEETAQRKINRGEGGYVPDFVVREATPSAIGAGLGAGVAAISPSVDGDRVETAQRIMAGAVAGAMLPLTFKGAKLAATESKMGRKLLTPGGVLAGAVRQFGDDTLEDMRRMLAGLSGQAAEADRIIAQASGDLHAAAQSLYGGRGRLRGVLSEASPFARMPDEVVDAIRRFMHGEQRAIGEIPEQLRVPVGNMRTQIDRYSKEFLDRGIVEGDLAVAFKEGMGAYLNRSYRIFDTPDWAKAAPRVLGEAEWEGIVNRFKNWYREMHQSFAERTGRDADLTDDDLDDVLELFLARGDNENALRFIQSGKLGKLNTKILAQRKNIPVEVRQLWGEQTDPWINYVRTMTNQATFLANHSFLTSMRRVGNGTFMWDPESGIRRPKGMTAEITKGDGPLAPLKGMWTTPELKAALTDQFKHESTGVVFKALMIPGSISKVAKTVGSQVTHIRNLMGNAMIATANGYWNPAMLAARGFRAWGDVFTAAGWRGGTGERREFVNKLVRLGVIDESANAQELEKALKAIRSDRVSEFFDLPVLGGVRNAYRTGRNFAFGMYRIEDDLWKVIAFGLERDRLLKAGLEAGDDLDQQVATIVRRTWPTFSMTPEIINQTRKIGGFLSFPAEVYRTGYGIFRQAGEELASENPVIRKIGAKRIASLGSAINMPLASAWGINGALGINDRDQDAVRTLSPPWSKNSTYLFLGKPKDGKFSYVDISYLSPYSYLSNPLEAFMRGEDWDVALREAAMEAASPFLSLNPLYSEMFETIKRADDKGLHEHPYRDAFIRGIEPGVIDQYARVFTGRSRGLREVDQLKEAAALATGVRSTEVDVREGIAIMAGGFNSRLGQQSAAMRKARTRGMVDRFGDQEKDFEKLQSDTQESINTIYREMMQTVAAAMQIGMTDRELRSILRGKKISRKNVNLIMSGAAAGERVR